MLFVRPGLQGDGIGAALMDLAQAGAPSIPVPGPDDPLDSGIHTWGMCTDAAQPISNGLYARRGMLPAGPGLAAVRRGAPVGRAAGAPGRRSRPSRSRRSSRTAPTAIVASPRSSTTLDRELIGAAHPADHAFLRREGRTGFLRARAGRHRAVAAGLRLRLARRAPRDRSPPLDPALHPALLGVAVRETPMLGAVAIWVPGTADRATRALLDAGLRYDGFPGLVCWSRPDHPFDRYVPISLALV